jgi:hypothetical protein
LRQSKCTRHIQLWWAAGLVFSVLQSLRLIPSSFYILGVSIYTTKSRCCSAGNKSRKSKGLASSCVGSTTIFHFHFISLIQLRQNWEKKVTYCTLLFRNFSLSQKSSLAWFTQVNWTELLGYLNGSSTLYSMGRYKVILLGYEKAFF